KRGVHFVVHGRLGHRDRLLPLRRYPIRRRRAQDRRGDLWRERENRRGVWPTYQARWRSRQRLAVGLPAVHTALRAAVLRAGDAGGVVRCRWGAIQEWLPHRREA